MRGHSTIAQIADACMHAEGPGPAEWMLLRHGSDERSS